MKRVGKTGTGACHTGSGRLAHRRRASFSCPRSSAVLSRRAVAFLPAFSGWKFSFEASQSASAEAAVGEPMAVSGSWCGAAAHALRCLEFMQPGAQRRLPEDGGGPAAGCLWCVLGIAARRLVTSLQGHVCLDVTFGVVERCSTAWFAWPRPHTASFCQLSHPSSLKQSDEITGALQRLHPSQGPRAQGRKAARYSTAVSCVCMH